MQKTRHSHRSNNDTNAVIAPANVPFIFDSEIATMPSHGCSDDRATGYKHSGFLFSYFDKIIFKS